MRDEDSSSELDRDRLVTRLGRYARLTGGLAGAALKSAARAATGGQVAGGALGRDLRALLGGLHGPIMKVGQFAAMMAEVLPPELSAELAQLQSNAPPMSASFVRRRMAAELGPDWRVKFETFDMEPVAAASLGQVHRATLADGRALACKLQYPAMDSAMAADMAQLSRALSLQRRFEPSMDTQEIERELRAGLSEELDYEREAAYARLFKTMLAQETAIRVPDIVAALSTRRLLTMTWLDGRRLDDVLTAPQDERDRLGALLARAWWVPLLTFGVVHGDPHLGNYSIDAKGGLNLFDFGCVRILPPSFVAGLLDLLAALAAQDNSATARALERMGFGVTTVEQAQALAPLLRLAHEPLLDDRMRPIAEGGGGADYLMKIAREKRERFKLAGIVRPPRAFVFHQRAMLGLGAALLKLGARTNWHRLFLDIAGRFDVEKLARRQQDALAVAGAPLTGSAPEHPSRGIVKTRQQ